MLFHEVIVKMLPNPGLTTPMTPTVERLLFDPKGQTEGLYPILHFSGKSLQTAFELAQNY